MLGSQETDLGSVTKIARGTQSLDVDDVGTTFMMGKMTSGAVKRGEIYLIW